MLTSAVTKTLLLSLLCLVTTGCATSITLASAPASQTGTIVNQMDRSRGTFDWRLFILRAVDSKPVNYSFMSDGRDDTIQVDAGERRLVVNAGFNAGLNSGGPRDAFVLLTVSIEPGRTYLLNGDVRDNLYYVWLEDVKSRQRASPEFSAPYRLTPQQVSSPIFIPVPKR